MLFLRQFVHSIPGAGQRHMGTARPIKSGSVDNLQKRSLPPETEPLPAKAGRFGLLLKQPKACTLKVIFFPLLLNLSQSYQSYSSPVDLDSEYTL